jgi:hypothetical protein
MRCCSSDTVASTTTARLLPGPPSPLEFKLCPPPKVICADHDDITAQHNNAPLENTNSVDIPEDGRQTEEEEEEASSQTAEQSTGSIEDNANAANNEEKEEAPAISEEAAEAEEGDVS